MSAHLTNDPKHPDYWKTHVLHVPGESAELDRVMGYSEPWTIKGRVYDLTKPSAGAADHKRFPPIPPKD